MTIDLSLHGRRVHSVFELLGQKENDITYSVGWALAQSAQFRAALVRRLFPKVRGVEIQSISLQERASDAGITDIELLGDNLHVIIEAKRGWSLPTESQLELYTPRLKGRGATFTALVTMSECAAEYAGINLTTKVAGIEVIHLPWKDVAKLTHINQGTHAEKRLLKQLRVYFERIVKMQNQESNLVYVVALSSKTPEWSKLSWIDIVEERLHYFHPLGVSGWPKEPPNYMGFRYHGQLQSIHHVDDWVVVTNIHNNMPELDPGEWEQPHFLYTLGPAIRPESDVKTGRIFRNGRVWAMLDLLLTCDTISDARDRTQERQAEDQ